MGILLHRKDPTANLKTWKFHPWTRVVSVLVVWCGPKRVHAWRVTDKITGEVFSALSRCLSSPILSAICPVTCTVFSRPDGETTTAPEHNQYSRKGFYVRYGVCVLGDLPRWWPLIKMSRWRGRWRHRYHLDVRARRFGLRHIICSLTHRL